MVVLGAVDNCELETLTIGLSPDFEVLTILIIDVVLEFSGEVEESLFIFVVLVESGTT